MKPTITLVNLGLTEPGQRYLPLGLLWLRASLEAAGVSVDLRDYQHLSPEERQDPAHLAGRLEDTPALVGLSAMSDALPLAVALTRELRRRRPERRVILGGPGPTAVARPLVAAFPWIDLVVRGEGEQALVDLVRALPTDEAHRVPGVSGRKADGPFHAPDRPPTEDLDGLPPPRLHDLPLSAYSVHSTVTSRGCPHRCRFCEIPSYGTRRVRRRSVETVVAELAAAHHHHGVRRVAFQDDVFLDTPGRVEAILDGLEAAGVSLQWGGFARAGAVDPAWLGRLAERGMKSVALGVEAGADPVLDRIAKGHTLKEAMVAIDAALSHVQVRCFFLWGFPHETLEEFLGTAHAAFHAEILGARPEIGQVVPLAGSPLYRHHHGAPLAFHAEYPFSRIIVPPRDPDLQRLVQRHPTVFPAQHAFPTPEAEAKWALAAEAWPAETAPATGSP